MADNGNYDDSEYELLPHQEIERLRREINQIKKNPFGDTDSSKSLLNSMEKLNSTLEAFIKLFEEARSDILEDYEKSNPSKRLDNIASQNEKIAKALLAVAEIAKNIKQDVDELKVQQTEAVTPDKSTDKGFSFSRPLQQIPVSRPGGLGMPPPPPPRQGPGGQAPRIQPQDLSRQPVSPNFPSPLPSNPRQQMPPPTPPVQRLGQTQQAAPPFPPPGDFNDIPPFDSGLGNPDFDNLPPLEDFSMKEKPKKKGLFGR